MRSEHELSTLLKLLSALLNKLEQREARMQGAIDQKMQALQGTVAQVERRVDGIVGSAHARIAEQAKAAVAPVAAEYARAVTATSGQLCAAGKTVWMWYAGLAALALLIVVAAWAVLGYYRRELVQVKEDLARYENAVEVANAFYASDATLCNGRICVQVDPKAKRYGDRGQYRQAKPR